MKTLQGVVISLKTQNTATVLTTRMWQHPTYGKSVKRSKKYAVDVPDNLKVAEGDEVIFAECPPVSKTKRFRIVEVVRQTQ